MSSNGRSGPPVGASPASTAPGRAGLVLASLILVAAVANLNLAVANVALPSIAEEFDAGQTALNLIAVGYSLGLAASVLYFGAIGDRYGRKLMLILGMALSIPACVLAAWAPTDEVLFGARLLGGLSAGMAYPTTLALITALWSGPGRTKSIALWSGIGGAISSLGPVLAGALLEEFWWGSVFLLTLPLAVLALVAAMLYVPSHVNEASDPVDNLGGILSVILVAALVLSINFAPVPDMQTLTLGLAAIALAGLVAFVIRQRRAQNPLYDLQVAGRRIFWVAATAGVIVFGTLMGAMFVGQQFLQNVLGYSTFEAGLSILPAAAFLVLVAPRSAKLVDARGARFTLLTGYFFCLLGFLVMLLLVGRGHLVLEGRSCLCPRRNRGRVRRHARLALTDRLRPRAARGYGLRHGGPPARSGRRDHAVDPRRAAHRRLRGGGHGGDRGGAEPGADHGRRRSPAHEVLRRRGDDRGAVPAVCEPDHRGGQVVVPRRSGLGLHRRNRRHRARCGRRLLPVPEAGGGRAAAGGVPRRGHCWWLIHSTSRARQSRRRGRGPRDGA